MKFSDEVIYWYLINRRQMPWRDNPDPYAIWVSEIMLQQTRVDSVLPYFEGWMEQFPTLQSLAEADLQDVLNAWEGLGYYSRARNLHRAARMVQENYAGLLPADTKALRSLPGIGPYTAGAIASLAFNQDEPVVDGNVRRVLARVFNLDIPADSTPGNRRLWQIATENLPSGKAKDYNQALMELGALVCTPVNPDCDHCPVSDLCEANQLGLQSERPVLKPRKKIPHFVVTAAVIRLNGSVLISKRPEKGMLGGMWEFPGGKQELNENLEDCLKREIMEELGISIKVGAPMGIYKHAYTHFRVTLHAFSARMVPVDQVPSEKGVDAFKWVLPTELNSYPMGKIDRQIAICIIDEIG